MKRFAQIGIGLFVILLLVIASFLGSYFASLEIQRQSGELPDVPEKSVLGTWVRIDIDPPDLTSTFLRRTHITFKPDGKGILRDLDSESSETFKYEIDQDRITFKWDEDGLDVTAYFRRTGSLLVLGEEMVFEPVGVSTQD